jgi:hypothetical protein
MSGLPFEIEVKARVADHAALRAALDSGATFVKEIEKADVYFADARLSAAEVSLDRDRVFRIRDVRGAPHVGLHGEGAAAYLLDFGNGGFRTGLVAVVVYCDVGAAAGEFVRDPAPDALAGAGDEGGLAGKIG